jgi:pyruvate dehydrogenase E2 component (dihydrolipoamide acetyltransferase)
MPIELRLPQLADAMTTAKLAVWLKREGAAVTGGEPIVEVETDKTTVELEAPGSGVLERILVAAGTEGVPVGALLAVIADDRVADAPAEAVVQAAPRPAPSVIEHKPAAAFSPEPSPAVVKLVAAPASQAIPDIPATPLAKRMAGLAGLDLATVVPDGGRTRITRSDVEIALQRRHPASAAVEARRTFDAIARVQPQERGAAFTDQPLSPMRRITAERLQRSKQTIPHFYLQADCRADALVDLRAQLNARASGIKVTITDLIVFAAARALRQVPQANAAWAETAVRVYDSVDIAVAVNTPKGLITPIVRGSHEKSLGAISLELSALVERARKGTLKPHEYTGGTFTISNLGMFGVTSITPIVNPPHACILGVGRIEDRAVVVDGQLAAGRTLSCTLAADHRIVDGATGAELLGEIRRLIEDPMAMALQV